MIKGVIFDFAEVLYNGLYGAEKYISTAVQREVTNKQIWNDPALQDFMVGKISEEQMWERVSRSLGWQVPIKSLQIAVRENFTEVPGTRDIVVGIRRRGLRLGLLSIHGKEWVEHLDRQHRFKILFDHVHFSYTTKVCKPEPAAYLGLTREMGLETCECLFIDDQDKNVRAARALGFQTELFTSAPELARKLRFEGLLSR